MDYIKAFVIGTTGIISVIFYATYFSVPEHMKTVTNESYVFGVPLYFGLMNMLSVFIKRRYNLSNVPHVLLMSIVSTLFVFSIAFFTKSYKIEGVKWIRYLVILFTLHLISYTILQILNLKMNL